MAKVINKSYRSNEFLQAFNDILNKSVNGSVCTRYTSTNTLTAYYYSPGETAGTGNYSGTIQFISYGADSFLPYSAGSGSGNLGGTYICSTDPSVFLTSEVSIWFPLAGLAIFIFICFLVYRIFIRRVLP